MKKTHTHPADTSRVAGRVLPASPVPIAPHEKRISNCRSPLIQVPQMGPCACVCVSCEYVLACALKMAVFFAVYG